MRHLIRLIVLLTCLGLLTACGSKKEVENMEYDFDIITQEEAKKIMDTQDGYVILDTRTEEEFERGHIPGAVVLSHEEVVDRAAEVLSDKDQLILVYCRSGRRSKLAANDLVLLGYTNVKEFGGILSWPYELIGERGE